MTDITPLFKACIKTVRLKNKSKIPVDHNQILKITRPRDELTKRALQIRTHLRQLHEFLLDHKSGYTRYANHLKDAVQMTDEERNIIDRESEKIIEASRATIVELRNELATRKMAAQSEEHFIGIMDLLTMQTKDVYDVYSKLKEYRVRHELETMQLLKLAAKQQPPKKPGTTDGFKVSLREGFQVHGQDEESVDAIGEMADRETKPLIEKNKYNKRGSIRTLSIQDQDDENTEEEEREMVGLSNDDIQLLESENVQLYQELAGLSDEVELINRNVVDIAKLQDFFTEKVTLQQHCIDRIANTVVTATENVKVANEQIEQAIQRNAGLRVWALFFLVVMSFSLLFLDWYND